MADYLLDTNMLSYWYDRSRPEHKKVLERVAEARRPDPSTGYISRLFVSVVTLGEIEYGHRANPSGNASQQQEYSLFVQNQCPVALELTKHVAEHYGELKGWLFNERGPRKKRSKIKRLNELVDPTTGEELGVDENDIWIAAQAKTHNLVLVTHDSRGNFGAMQRAFSEVLQIDDWAA